MIGTEFRLDKLRAGIFVIAIFLLGMPLEGVIPTPPGNSRETVRIDFVDKAGDEKLNTTIIWSTLYLTSFLLLLHRRTNARAAFLRQPFVFVVAVLVGISAIWSGEGTKALVTAIQLLGASAVALTACVRYATRPMELLAHAAWALGLNQLVNLASILFLPGDTIHPDGRWAGVTGSANYLGALAFCGAWATAAMLLRKSAKSRFPYLVLFIFSIVSLYGSGSVTSTVSAAIAITALLYYSPLGSGVRFSVGKRAIIILAVLLLSVIGTTYGISHVFELFGRRSDFSGRVDIWEGGISLFRERPLIGHGYGSDTESLGVTHWATSFHNGYLDIAVKLGSFGMLALGAVFFRFWHHLMILRQTAFAGSVRYTAAFAVGVFVYNLTEAAFLGARNPTWLILLVLIYTAALQSSRRVSLKSVGKYG